MILIDASMAVIGPGPHRSAGSGCHCRKRLDSRWAAGRSFDAFCRVSRCLGSTHELEPANADITNALNADYGLWRRFR